jgi:peptide-methionine (R)-S-oxide reductase
MAMDLSEDEWKKKLSPEQYHVLREKGTEVPGTGKFLYNTESGDYTCAACGTMLFHSDNSMFMQRTEVICKNCGGHLGHVFPDDSSPTGQHFCINSAALDFKKQ